VEDSTLRRGLAVLAALGREEAVAAGGLGVVRISQMIGCDKSQASRTLKTLAELGLVERPEGARVYRLGWQLYGLALRAGDQRLLHFAPTLLRRLTADLGEPSYLAVMQKDEVLTIASESSIRAIQVVTLVGRRVPAVCTASGRVLLFDHDREEVAHLFAKTDFRRHGPNAPKNINDLMTRIATARARGYAVADEELEAGLLTIAAPVRDFSGRVVAAVGMSAPKPRLAPRLEVALRGCVRCARELSTSLGAQPRVKARA
jgi:DNA-binding IclR family transcriptional regulator